MTSFQECINEYKKQLKKGAVQVAYRGLMEYIMGLRTHFSKKFPEYDVPGNIYYGYMDMTYFSIIPKSIKERKLKIAIVFLHEAFRFEVWLSGVNRQVQKRYWEMIKKSGWNKYRLVNQEKGVDSIIEHVLIDDPDFNDLTALTTKIEKGVLKFTKEIEENIE